MYFYGELKVIPKIAYQNRLDNQKKFQKNRNWINVKKQVKKYESILPKDVNPQPFVLFFQTVQPSWGSFQRRGPRYEVADL